MQAELSKVTHGHTTTEVTYYKKVFPSITFILLYFTVPYSTVSSSDLLDSDHSSLL